MRGAAGQGAGVRAVTVVAAPLLVLAAVVWGVCAGVGQVRRDLASLVRIHGLPSLDGRVRVPDAVALAIANDARIVALARRQFPDWVEDFKPLGAGKLANEIGLMLVGGGLLHGDRRAVVGGLTLLEGNLIVGVVIDGAKAAFGRVRPNHPGPGRWFAGGTSFPSSHTTHAFLIASVLSTTFDEPESRDVFWWLAVGVALQRLHEGVHYPTDVIAGGALGWWIGDRLCLAHGLVARRW
jgi:membrane-associated phospholipid phosphatase